MVVVMVPVVVMEPVAVAMVVLMVWLVLVVMVPVMVPEEDCQHRHHSLHRVCWVMSCSRRRFRRNQSLARQCHPHDRTQADQAQAQRLGLAQVQRQLAPEDKVDLAMPKAALHQ
jgi:hypothetical protein